MIPFALFFITVLALACYPLTAFFATGLRLPHKTARARIIRAAIALALATFGYFVRVVALGLLLLCVLVGIAKLLALAFCRVVKERRTKLCSALRFLYRSGIAFALILAVTFSVGYFKMNNVVQTTYTVQSQKLSQPYRIVFLSDLHYGTVQNPSVLEEKVAEINALQADLILLGGDITEEGTTKAQMLQVYAILGRLQSRYGTYFVYGNHDRQRYSASPSYTEEELYQAITANGITILKEDAVAINSDLTLLGREDIGASQDRLDAQTLSQKLDPSRFLLVTDHQPNDTESNAQLGADLQLSGHTHSGQIFPLGCFSFLYQGFVYGQYQVEHMSVIVSSGFAGWGFPIRTQSVSEYVVVDLIP